jgi:hypothetical protein
VSALSQFYDGAMADESITLRVGQDHAVRLDPHGGASDWSAVVEGMASAVDVRKMWTSRPYEEDEEDPPRVPPRRMVFLIRGVAPGEARVVFRAASGDEHAVGVRVDP